MQQDFSREGVDPQESTGAGTRKNGIQTTLGVVTLKQAKKPKHQHIRDAKDDMDRMNQKMIHDKKLQDQFAACLK